MKHDWEYKKVGDVCAPKKHILKASNCFEGNDNIQYIDISSIDNKSQRMTGVSNYIMSDAPSRAQQCVQKGDILVSTVRPNLKNIAVVDREDNNLVASSGFCVLRVTGIELNYLFHYITSEKFTNHLMNLTTGANYPAVRDSDILEMIIPVPPLPTQQSIVSELDSLSQIIADCKETLKDYDALEQSIFYDMFGDPVKNDKGWEVKELGTICDVTSFKRVLIEDVVDEGIPFVRGTELTEMCGLTSGEQMKFSLFITNEHYERVKKITGVPSVGDLLIPSINSKGYVWIVDTTEPMYYKDGRVLWVHMNNDYFSSEYLQRTIKTILLDSYSLMASGATFAELKLFILRELNVPVPPLPLQQQFASKIEAIEQMKSETKKALQEAETLFNARMDYWFN